MDTGTVSIIMFFVIAVPTALMVWLYNSGETKKAKNPEKVLRKIREIRDPVKMREAYRKWTNPEIRKVAAHQLSAPNTAEMLRYMNDREISELVTYYSDMDELADLQRFTGSPKYSNSSAHRLVSKRLEVLAQRKVDACGSQEALSALIEENANPVVCRLAVEKLTDQTAIEDCAVRAAIRGDDSLLKQMLEKMDDPQRLQNRPEFTQVPPQQKAAVREFVLCRGKHTFVKAYRGVCTDRKSYYGLGYHDVRICRVCGRRNDPLETKEHAGEILPFISDCFRETVTQYQAIMTMTDPERDQLIRDPGKPNMQGVGMLRVAAAERISDQEIILGLLRDIKDKEEEKDPNSGMPHGIAGPIRQALLWQLEEPEEGGLFESIAKDRAYDKPLRATVVRRIFDLDTLERLKQDKTADLAYECRKQCSQVLCPGGHKWILEEHEELDGYQEGWEHSAIRKLYRCERCGETKLDVKIIPL